MKDGQSDYNVNLMPFAGVRWLGVRCRARAAVGVSGAGPLSQLHRPCIDVLRASVVAGTGIQLPQSHLD